MARTSGSGVTVRLTLADVEEASVRIRDKIRRTPIIKLGPLHQPFDIGGADLTLKLECLQVTGSFKPRGASNKAAQLTEQQIARGLCTASGGNHGLAVAYVGSSHRVATTVFVPRSTSDAKAERIRAWGGDVVIEGDTWDQANEAAMIRAKKTGAVYIHPFSDPTVIAGQGTVGLEILADQPQIDTVLVAIGGGGLIAGVATAVRALKPEIRVIGVEPVGAPTLKESVSAGHLVTLDSILTVAGTLAPQRSAQINLDVIRREVEQIVLISDDDMKAAARWLWFELGVATELSGAATLAALMTAAYRPQRDENVLALVCGAGTDGLFA